MNRPLVTIGIPTYNRADGYLREALADALAQTYAPLEIVVSDNASTDATPELVRGLADERVRYVRHEANIGGNANFNACLENARGEYFLLLHDDDRIDPDFVAACMEAVDRAGGTAPPGIVRTGTRVIDAQGAVLSERRNEAPSGTAADLMLSWFGLRTSMYFCSTLYRTEALREAGGFSSPHGLYIDVIAAVRIAAEHPTLDVPEVKASFRRHGGNHGGVRAIEAWCEDSLFLLDLACDVAGDRAAELRAIGLRYFTTNNYSRVARLAGAADRARAYWTVYRYFGFRASPLRYVAIRRLRRWRQSWRAASV
jgi:glycosyltransferase involved in cell wall biosynthesis